MKYKIESEFACDPRELLETMFARDAVDRLAPLMSRITEAETLEWKETPRGVKRRVRYLPVPAIKSVGPKKVEPRWMEWIEESEADFESLEVRYRNVPTTPRVAELLFNRGEMKVIDLSGGGCMRIISGVLEVKVFLVGALAERLIHSYAKEIIEEEASALRRILGPVGR